MNNTPYLSSVGALMYLATTTRTDIAYTVGVLARFNHNPGVQHWTAVKHLLSYLKGTVDYSLILGPDPSSKELFKIMKRPIGGKNRRFWVFPSSRTTRPCGHYQIGLLASFDP